MQFDLKALYAGLTVQDEIEEREADFADAFGSDGFFEEALITCLQKIDRICAVYFGDDVAKAGLDAMVGRYFPELVAKGGWAYALEEEYSGIYSELPIGGLFHDLDAYANFGLVFRRARDVEIREKALGEMVRTAEEFLAAVPLEAWGIQDEHAVKLVRKAAARFRLDTGEPVNSEQLAVLSGLAHQSIKNRLGGATKELEGSQSRIEAREALAWLASRKDFLPSLWRQQDDSRMFAFLEIQLEDAVFVPVANDGSMFTPNKKKDGYFFVGLEGHERRFEDYEEALAVLQKMPVPSWRRPTEGGTWTRVKANGWARVLRSDLPTA